MNEVNAFVLSLIIAGVIAFFDPSISEQFRSGYLIGTVLVLILITIGLLINKPAVLFLVKTTMLLLSLSILIILIFYIVIHLLWFFI